MLKLARSGSNESLTRLLERSVAKLLQTATVRLGATEQAAMSPEAFVQIVLQDAERDFVISRCETKTEFDDWLNSLLENHLDTLQQTTSSESIFDGSFPIVLQEESNVYPDDRTSIQQGSVVEEPMSKEFREAVEAAVNRLPEPLRVILLLHNRDGYSFDDIAARTGRTPDEARISWAKAIELLKDLLPRDEASA